jgi:hypothetical protein
MLSTYHSRSLDNYLYLFNCSQIITYKVNVGFEFSQVMLNLISFFLSSSDSLESTKCEVIICS